MKNKKWESDEYYSTENYSVPRLRTHLLDHLTQEPDLDK